MIADFERAVRLGASSPRTPWRSIGCEVWSGRRVIGRMQDPVTAEVVALLANVARPAWNQLVRVTKEAEDRKRVLEVSRGI